MRIEPTRLVVLSKDKLLAIADADGVAPARRQRHRSDSNRPMSTLEANTGTKPVAEQHAFDVAALERYLQAHLPGFAGPLDGRAVQGRPVESDLQADRRRRARYVMRTKPGPAAKLLPSAHAVEREFRVMRALAGTDVPVPRMLRAVRGRGGDRPRLLRDGVRRRPRALGPVAARHSTPAQRGAIYDEMNRVIAALHIGRLRTRVGLGRLRQAGQLLRAPDRPLDQAVPAPRSPSRSRRWTG